MVVTAVPVFLEHSGDVEDNVGLGSAAYSSTKGPLFKLIDGVERQESLKPMMGSVKSCNSRLIIWDEVIRSRGAGTSGGELAPLCATCKFKASKRNCLFLQFKVSKSC